MAFNPFNWFRKHQKKLISVVIIFVMFIFILSFGKGDAFERLTGRLGARGGRGEVIATINGSTIKESETSKLTRHRKAASEFLLTQALENHSKALDNLLQKELPIDAGAGRGDPKFLLRDVCQNVQRREPQRLQMMAQFNPDGLMPQIGMFLGQQIPGDLGILESLSASKEYLKSDSKDKLAQMQKIATIIGYQLWVLSRWAFQMEAPGHPAAADDLCFGGNSKSLEDNLDFIMWRDLADKMGVRLTDADLAQQLNREAATELFSEPDKVELAKDKKVTSFLSRREYSDVSATDFVEALRQEFRVVMVQGILLGGEPGVRAYRGLTGVDNTPAAGTPDEFLSYYRENRTTLKVQLLPVSAEKFLDQVKETPTDAQLRARYERYRDKERLPDSRDPGFKESRRVLVQYLIGDVNAPTHRALAKKQAAAWASLADSKSRAARVFGSAVGSPSLLGAGPLGPIAGLLAPVALDPLGADYDRYLNDQPPWLSAGPPPGTFDDPNRPGLIRDETLLSARVLGAAVAAGTRGPIAAVNGLYAAATAHEVRRSTRQIFGAMLAASDVSNVLAAAALAIETQPDVRTFDQTLPTLLISLEDRVARDLLRDQYETIAKGLKEVSKDAKKADDYVQKVLKDYPALKLVSMAEPTPLVVMVEQLETKTNPKLAELLEPIKKKIKAQNDRELAVSFFLNQGAYDAQRAKPRDRQFERLRMAAPETEYEQVEYLWWRKDDLPARVRPFEDVRDEVVKAWKMDRARTLARTEADRLTQEINKKKWSAEDAERFLRENEAKYGPVFDLENVSQLVAPQEVMMQSHVNYRPYQVPTERRAQMPYAGPDLVQQLMTLERPGQATAVGDAPQRTFYVAVLVARDVPSVSSFRQDAYKRVSRTDPLYVQFTNRRAGEYRRAVTEYLRREAGKVGKDGRFEIPEDVKRRETRSSDDVE